MSLLRMSFSGGVLILAIIVLRALALHRLPKRTFLVLWAVAVLRLLVPFSVSSVFSIYSLAREWGPVLEEPVAAPAVPASPVLPAVENQPEIPSVRMPSAAPTAPVTAESGTPFPLQQTVWLAGVVLCGLFFLITYLRCCREFRTALPLEEGILGDWPATHRLRRPLTLRQTDRIATPLTYGIFHPVILLPSHTDWQDTASLPHILEHEYVHVQRFHALAKLVLAAAACVHWFNPLVWCMYVLANRDMELSCDEAVVQQLGIERRSGYAKTIISMEERKSGLAPFTSAFSKNAIEERIVAIMKIKKHSLAAVLAAVVLICGISAVFATSAAAKEDLRDYLTALPGDEFTQEESQRLFALWFDGYETMTAGEYREKMRAERTDADLELIERFSLSEVTYALPSGKEAEALAAFNAYFFDVYEPLTADRWLSHSFDGSGSGGAEYICTLTILDQNALTVKDYEQTRQDAEKALRSAADASTAAAALERLSSTRLHAALDAFIPIPTDGGEDLDADLLKMSSQETSDEWDRLLSPYAPFGLTWQFDDPDNDGNGLTMWYNGKEVRGILDEQEGLWITEHTGITSYASDAIELYTVYTNGLLTGLRPATPEEQAMFTEDRVQSSAAAGLLGENEEMREFPQATRTDYDSILTLKTANYSDMSLEDFNQRLLDWANENSDAYDRISCDVLWNDCAVDLTDEEWDFISHTCHLSGVENAMMIRSLYTGQPEDDPGFAANLPMLSQEVNGATAAWCDLYYDLCYHISDKSTVTVGERDRCTAAMMDAINAFWQDTDIDTLLTMTKSDVVARFNTWAADCGTEHVAFHHVTEDQIHYECMDERHIFNEYPQTTVHHPEPEHQSEQQRHHSDRHHG